MGGKRDDIEPFRPEIEQRTAAGENCEQIAAALKAQGCDVSSKTVSRYRVSWGIRQRAEPKTKGRKYPNRKRTATKPTKHQAQDARKAEITARTERGESAEQIAAALQAQGFTLSKGPSTIWRLQTYWGLIPYDHARARGKYSEAEKAKRAARDGTPKVKRTRQPGVEQYPPNCAFAPGKRPLAPRPVDLQSNESSPEPISFMTGVEAIDEPSRYHQSTGSMGVAADLMSAEMLVDLAMSTLNAANKVKELYLALQAQPPLSGTIHDEIAAAKRKVQEAAAVMHDLVLPKDSTGSSS